jgi:PAS domain-containing protein
MYSGRERTKEVQILADLSPAGLFRIDLEGNMLICNDRYRELSGMEKGHETDW